MVHHSKRAEGERKLCNQNDILKLMKQDNRFKWYDAHCELGQGLSSS